MTKDSKDHDIENDQLKNTNDSFGFGDTDITRQRIHKDCNLDTGCVGICCPCVAAYFRLVDVFT